MNLVWSLYHRYTAVPAWIQITERNPEGLFQDMNKLPLESLEFIHVLELSLWVSFCIHAVWGGGLKRGGCKYFLEMLGVFYYWNMIIISVTLEASISTRTEWCSYQRDWSWTRIKCWRHHQTPQTAKTIWCTYAKDWSSWKNSKIWKWASPFWDVWMLMHCSLMNNLGNARECLCCSMVMVMEHAHGHDCGHILLLINCCCSESTMPSMALQSNGKINNYSSKS